MKNKKLIILFFVLLTLIYPLEKVYAQSIFDRIKDAVGKFFENVKNTLVGIKECLGDPVFCAISIIVYAITWLFHQVLWFFNTLIFAPLVNFASQLNPFFNTGAGSPAFLVWSILVSYGYIILVFSALSAAFDWLFGQDATALRKIFIIILVALIINFTFVLIEEAFKVIQSIESGITNNQAGQIGSIMAASLWQKDPFQEIAQISERINDKNTTFKHLTQAVLYIFIVVFDMGMLIILVVALSLFIARYFYILALTAVSPIAVAVATLPEFRAIPGLREFLAGFRFTSEWFGMLVRWLLVAPIFVILVILCNITKENILAQVSAGDLMQFIMLFLGFTICYAGSIKVAVSLGGFVAAWAKGIAAGVLLGIGGLAAKGLFTLSQGAVGNILAQAGGKIEEKVGVGGTLGWRTWVGQKIGKGLRERGEKMIKRRYGLEAEAVKGTIGGIDEQLRRITDPAQIQNLTSQLAQLVQRYKGNDYILASVNEAIRGMSPYSASKILASVENLRALASPDVPQETREAIIGLVEKLRKGDLKRMAGEAEWLRALGEISPDVADVFLDRFSKEFKETDGLEIISKVGISQLPENFRRTIDSITKGFIQALSERNIENISNAIASWEESVLLQPEITEKLKQLFVTAPFTDKEKINIILEAIKKSKNREAFVIAASREKMGGFLRKMFASLTDEEIRNLENLLREEYRDTLDTIILEELEHQEQKWRKLLEEGGQREEGGPQQLSLGL
jgi:hypothetical protein